MPTAVSHSPNSFKDTHSSRQLAGEQAQLQWSMVLRIGGRGCAGLNIAEDDPHPSPGRQAARHSNDHPSVTKGKRMMVIQAGQDLDPDLSGDPLAKMVKTDNVK